MTKGTNAVQLVQIELMNPGLKRERGSIGESASPKTLISRKNAAYHRSPTACESWQLVNNAELCIVEGMVPVGAKEALHYHGKARQFLYVVDGVASLEVDGKVHQIRKGQGLEVDPGVHHRLMNRSDRSVVFLVISTPSAKGDRVEV